MTMINGQTILEEEYDEDYQPTEDDIREYASVIGINPDTEPELMWLARDGITAALPDHWKPCQDERGEIYYFNFQTGASIWDHPCDELYKERVQKERQKLHSGAGRKEKKKTSKSTTKQTKAKTSASIVGRSLSPINSLRGSGNLLSGSLNSLGSSLGMKGTHLGPIKGHARLVNEAEAYLRGSTDSHFSPHSSLKSGTLNLDIGSSTSQVQERIQAQLRGSISDEDDDDADLHEKFQIKSPEDIAREIPNYEETESDERESRKRSSESEDSDDYRKDVDFHINDNISERLMELEDLQPAGSGDLANSQSLKSTASMHDRPDLTGKSSSEAGRASNANGEKHQVATYIGKSSDKKGAYTKFKAEEKKRINFEEQQQKITKDHENRLQQYENESKESFEIKKQLIRDKYEKELEAMKENLQQEQKDEEAKLRSEKKQYLEKLNQELDNLQKDDRKILDDQKEERLSEIRQKVNIEIEKMREELDEEKKDKIDRIKEKINDDITKIQCQESEKLETEKLKSAERNRVYDLSVYEMFVPKIEKASSEMKKKCKSMKRWGVFCMQRCGDCLNDDCNPYDGTCERGCAREGYVYESRCTNDGGALTPTVIDMPNMLEFRNFWSDMRRGVVNEWKAICRGNQRWGPFCLFPCPKNCLSGCDYSDGTCNRGLCTKGFVGLRCDRLSTIAQSQKAEAEASSLQIVFPGFTIAFVILSTGGMVTLCLVVVKDRKMPQKYKKGNRKKSVDRRKSTKRNSTKTNGNNLKNAKDVKPQIRNACLRMMKTNEQNINKSNRHLTIGYSETNNTVQNSEINQLLSSIRKGNKLITENYETQKIRNEIKETTEELETRLREEKDALKRREDTIMSLEKDYQSVLDERTRQLKEQNDAEIERIERELERSVKKLQREGEAKERREREKVEDELEKKKRLIKEEYELNLNSIRKEYDTRVRNLKQDLSKKEDNLMEKETDLKIRTEDIECQLNILKDRERELQERKENYRKQRKEIEEDPEKVERKMYDSLQKEREEVERLQEEKYRLEAEIRTLKSIKEKREKSINDLERQIESLNDELARQSEKVTEGSNETVIKSRKRIDESEEREHFRRNRSPSLSNIDSRVFMSHKKPERRRRKSDSMLESDMGIDYNEAWSDDSSIMDSSLYELKARTEHKNIKEHLKFEQNSITAAKQFLNRQKEHLLKKQSWAVKNQLDTEFDEEEIVKEFHKVRNKKNMFELDSSESDESSGISVSDVLDRIELDTNSTKLRHLYNVDQHKSGNLENDNGALKIEDTLKKINTNINQVLSLIGQSRTAIGQSTNSYLSKTTDGLNLSVPIIDNVEKCLESKKRKYLGDHKTQLPLSQTMPTSLKYQLGGTYVPGANPRFREYRPYATAFATDSQTTEMKLHQHRQWLKEFRNNGYCLPTDQINHTIPNEVKNYDME
ncbi:DgyrCDS4761 [Dimorphilus gyrociliatus]|uniref:Centrosomal protein of 164 kDa n=1 Tax=Dimorphilus gyrociliatus TaxID=2664684 RepID=A0A7I8VHQ3_9ANNE|nr:DgyrCDS4761 [Dimorphilus gyrociliatus]